jgi:hypothetical protein
MEPPVLGRAKIDVFFSRQGTAWRLYVHGWIAPYVKQRLDEHGEASPVLPPNLEELHRYMWQLDAPYLQKMTTVGGVAIEAKGRSAVALWEWLYEHLAAAELER